MTKAVIIRQGKVCKIFCQMVDKMSRRLKVVAPEKKDERIIGV